MGLTTLPEVGTGEALGPVKVSRPLAVTNPVRDIAVAEWNAAMAALEAVCAEVGLHDGSTSGSLVERVDALEDGGGGGGSGDVVGPSSAVNNNIVAFDTTTGKLIKDSGVATGAIAAAQADATQALSDAAAAQATADAAASGVITRRAVTTNAGVTDTDAGKHILALADSADIVLQLQDSCVSGQRFTVSRGYTVGSDPGYVVTIAGVDGDHVITGPTTLAMSGGVYEVLLQGINGSTYHWTISPLGHSEYAPSTSTSATRTIADADRDRVLRISAASNAVAIEIPDTLPGGQGSSGDVFEVSLDIVDATTNAVTISTGAGLLTPVYYGPSAIAEDDTQVYIRVTRGVAHVTVVEPGDAFGSHIASTSNPHSVTAAQVGADPKMVVQSAHTSSTLTLADADNNQHRALNTASNSIAISIPDDLTFPFVWTARKSSASNSVTITTGAGLITPKTSGTVPVTAVDSYITIFAESSTVAAVFVAEVA